MKYFYFLTLFIFVNGCKYNNGSSLTTVINVPKQSNSSATTSKASNVYEDGTYCATIKYYNPDTETNSYCNLSVEVKNNELAQINSCDCSWLNESQFMTKKLDETGSVTFTGNKGNEYTITVDENSPLRSKKFQCDICGKEIK